MPPDNESLSTSTMLALAVEILSDNGYRVVRHLADVARSSDRSLWAEDASSVVSIVAFDTWQQLADEWLEAQADLVDLLSRRLARSAPKAWDGYLVLLCSGQPLDRSDAVAIERDTTKVRKIVATAEILRTSTDVARTLDPLLPLVLPEAATALTDVLDDLPELMRETVDPAAMRAVIAAHRAMEPPLERLQEQGRA